MNVKDMDQHGGHEIDPNLVEIADMLRIQEEMQEVNEHARNRMRRLIRDRRTTPRQPHPGLTKPQQRNTGKGK